MSSTRRIITARSKPSLIPPPQKIVGRARVDTGLRRGKKRVVEAALDETECLLPVVEENKRVDDGGAALISKDVEAARDSQSTEAPSGTASLRVVEAPRGGEIERCDVAVQAIPDEIPFSPSSRMPPPGSVLRRAHRGLPVQFPASPLLLTGSKAKRTPGTEPKVPSLVHPSPLLNATPISPVLKTPSGRGGYGNTASPLPQKLNFDDEAEGENVMEASRGKKVTKKDESKPKAKGQPSEGTKMRLGRAGLREIIIPKSPVLISEMARRVKRVEQ